MRLGQPDDRWLKPFVIVVISLTHDFLVSNWGIYVPTRWDCITFFGTLGFFFLAFAFIRVLPMISIFEMHDLPPSAHVKGAALKESQAAMNAACVFEVRCHDRCGARLDVGRALRMVLGACGSSLLLS